MTQTPPPAAPTFAGAGPLAPAPTPGHPGLVTTQRLIEHLTDAALITAADVISLLGDQRTSQSVNVLEIALVRQNVLNREELLARKAALSGLPAYPDGRTPVRKHLSESAAAQTGALVLERSPLTVVMVEPTLANLTAVSRHLGTQQFEVWTTTAPHFAELLTATYRGGAITNLEVAPDLFTILDSAISRRASDVHLKVGLAPRLRVDGAMVGLQYRPVDQQWVRRAVDAIASERHLAELARKFSTDFAYSFGGARFRVNAANDADGGTMVLRRLPTDLPTADDLSLPTTIRKFAELERGLVLVTGPTGSGKSTTLAAVLNIIIHSSSRHVITLEDPIEFRFPSDRASLVNQRELGSSFASFPDGIRDALRQDPDVMLVGEMRDQATIRAALELADTGHLVLASLHTADAPSTVQRVVNTFPANEQDAVRVQLAQLLKGCVSQTLLPRATGKGRVAAFEILVSNPAISTNLRKIDGANSLKQTMQTSGPDGMRTMEQSLARLVHDGIVTEPEAAFRAQDVEEFHRQLLHLASH